MPEVVFNFPHRISELRRLLAAEKADVLIVSNIENARYLTGFSGSNALLLVTPTETVFLTDGRYKIQAARETPGFERVILPQGSDLAQSAAEEINKRGLKRVGFESNTLTVAAFTKLKEAAQAGVELVPFGGLVESVRYIKDAAEVSAIRRAITLADLCWNHIVQITKPGVTERELAWAIEVFLRENGATSLSFESIVASGPHSALPHARPTDRVLSKDGTAEFVIFDYGCILDGYCSDITRTLVVGTPTDEHRRIYDSVYRAQQRPPDPAVWAPRYTTTPPVTPPRHRETVERLTSGPSERRRSCRYFLGRVGRNPKCPRSHWINVALESLPHLAWRSCGQERATAE